MNLNSNRIIKDAFSASKTRPVVLEVVSEVDARGDLTAAFDIRATLNRTCEVHVVRLGDTRSVAPTGADAHLLRWNGTGQYPGLSALLEELQPDIVHTHRARDLGEIGAAARAAGVPRLIHSLCGEFASADETRVAGFLSLASELQPVVVAPTAAVACSLDTAAEVAVIPRGVDLVRNCPGEARPARRKIGLPLGPRIVACASPAAGLDILLQSLFRLDKDVHLALFGPATPGPAERATIHRFGLEERIHVLGAWAQPELVHQAADVYFHGPSADSTPRPLLAAQAAGKPAIATFPAEPGLLCPETGQLLPPQFQPAIDGALKRALAASPAPQARTFVERNWDNTKEAAAYEELFLSTEMGAGGRLSA